MKGPDRMAFGLVLILVGLGLFLSGINWNTPTRAASVAATPEEAVEHMLRAAHQGNYDQAARFFEGGPEIWEHSPSWARQHIDHVTDRGNALTIEVHAQGTHGEETLLQITTYTDPERANPLRTQTWRFVREGSGWVIRKVE